MTMPVGDQFQCPNCGVYVYPGQIHNCTPFPYQQQVTWTPFLMTQEQGDEIIALLGKLVEHFLGEEDEL